MFKLIMSKALILTEKETAKKASKILGRKMTKKAVQESKKEIIKSSLKAAAPHAKAFATSVLENEARRYVSFKMDSWLTREEKNQSADQKDVSGYNNEHMEYNDHTSGEERNNKSSCA